MVWCRWDVTTLIGLLSYTSTTFCAQHSQTPDAAKTRAEAAAQSQQQQSRRVPDTPPRVGTAPRQQVSVCITHNSLSGCENQATCSAAAACALNIPLQPQPHHALGFASLLASWPDYVPLFFAEKIFFLLCSLRRFCRKRWLQGSSWLSSQKPARIRQMTSSAACYNNCRQTLLQQPGCTQLPWPASLSCR